VVLYARDGRFFIHRNLRSVQRGAEPALVTRGDSMPQVDEPVIASELLGKVISIGGGSDVKPVPSCTLWRRAVGLLLVYSGRLRSLALRWHKPLPKESAQELVGGEVLR